LRNSLDLKKQDISIYFSSLQINYAKRWYLPTISLQGGISFTGSSYPLTEPRYSLRFVINFANNILFPSGINTGYGFERNRLYSVSNSADLGIRANPSYFNQQRLSNLTILQGQYQRIQMETEIRENFYSIVESHDNTIRSATITQYTITLFERRLEYSKLQLENGEKKSIDYLEELINLSQAKISLIEYSIAIITTERNIEILANIPFGELKNVCTE
jgi:outer membrane protein TolC